MLTISDFLSLPAEEGRRIGQLTIVSKQLKFETVNPNIYKNNCDNKVIKKNSFNDLNFSLSGCFVLRKCLKKSTTFFLLFIIKIKTWIKFYLDNCFH